jgi:hypothetical protein
MELPSSQKRNGSNRDRLSVWPFASLRPAVIQSSANGRYRRVDRNVLKLNPSFWSYPEGGMI